MRRYRPGERTTTSVGYYASCPAEQIKEIEFLLLARLRGSGDFDARLLPTIGGARDLPESLPTSCW